MMVRTSTRIVLFVLALGAASFAAAQRERGLQKIDLPEIVQKAIRAFVSSRYSGERVVELREGPERIRNREIIWKDGTRVRVEYGQGSRSFGQIIVDRGKGRLHYFPDQNEIHVSPSSHGDALMRLVKSIQMGVRGNGKVVVGEGDPVAGHRTSKVQVLDPRGHVWQALWIEPRTGVILKREFYDRVGTRDGYFEFTKINFQPILRNDDFEIKVPGAKVISQADLALRLMKKGQFLKVFLEEGPELELQSSRVFGNGSVLALHYSSPKGILSFMQAKGQLEPKMLEHRRRDGQNVYAWERSGKSFVLIGPHTESQLRALSQRTHER